MLLLNGLFAILTEGKKAVVRPFHQRIHLNRPRPIDPEENTVMREKIGGFSELTGCSEQTIRYYESLGLLHPEHAGESGYRYFTEQNLAELTQVRMLRGLDVPLARIAQGKDDIPFLLSEQEQALSERISQLEDELQRVRRLQQRFVNATGTPQPVSLNGVWRLMLSDPGVLASPEGRSLAKEWIALMPYSHYTIIIPQEQIETITELMPDCRMTFEGKDIHQVGWRKADEGSYYDWYKEVREIFGYDRNDFSGKRW